MNEKQLKQVSENLKAKSTSQNKPLSSALSSIPRLEGDDPVALCGCGEPRTGAYFKFLGRCVFTKWCPECEVKYRKIAIRKDHIEKADKMRKMIKRSLPAIYHEAHLKRVHPAIVAHIRTKTPGQGIYIWGDVGRGKTYIASALLRPFIVSGRSARRAPLKDIVDEIQATFSDYGLSAEMVFKKYIMTGLLCIEDIGTGKNGSMQSDFNQDVLLKLIDRRIENKRTTIITSNLSPENICDAFGGRVFSRLSTFLIIELAGRDRRQP